MADNLYITTHRTSNPGYRERYDAIEWDDDVDRAMIPKAWEAYDKLMGRKIGKSKED